MRSKRLGVIAGFASGVLGIVSVPVYAQDGATLDQTRKMYQDALSQLKSAQDRKSELANENVKLTSRITELEKQVDDARHKAAGEAERTYLYRARLAAWETFMKQNPETLERWRDWLSFGTHPGALWQLGDVDWPWDAG